MKFRNNLIHHSVNIMKIGEMELMLLISTIEFIHLRYYQIIKNHLKCYAIMAKDTC